MLRDASKQQGGDLGWLLSQQLVPPVANVVVNLPLGGAVVSPIQTETGWHVLRLQDKRAYVAPGQDPCFHFPLMAPASAWRGLARSDAIFLANWGDSNGQIDHLLVLNRGTEGYLR